MLPHRKPTLEEQLAEAQAALKAANKEKAKLAAALAKKTAAKRKLIPRPKGQARKGSGYNLLEKMRLARNKTRYNRLMNIVRYYANRFLNTAKTLSGQDKTRLEKVIKTRFEGAWPIRAFLKQYLANNHDKHKRAVRQERAAEEQDTDDWSAAAQDGESGENVGDANSDPENDDIELDTKDEGDGDVDDGDADDDLDAILEDKDMNFDSLDLADDLSIGDDSSPKKSRKSVKENVAPNLKGDSGDVKGKTKLKPTSVKRKSAESSTDTAMPAKKKAKTSDASPLKPFTDADILQECPDTHCSDSVPRPLPPALFSLFAQKHALVQKEGAKAPGCRQLTREICLAIEKELEPEHYRTKAREQGWPTKIKFDDLSARITNLLPDLNLLLTDSDALSDSVVWTTFLERIDHRVFAFLFGCASSIEFNPSIYSYGPMGQSVILNALERSFGAEDDFPHEPDLYATISPLIDKPQNWDEFDDASNLISFKKFTKFILIPAVATNLIAEDLECDLKDALDILEDSRRCGEVLHADRPRKKIDVYAIPKTEEASAPPRLRKKVSLILQPEIKTKLKKNPNLLVNPADIPKLKCAKHKEESARQALVTCLLFVDIYNGRFFPSPTTISPSFGRPPTLHVHLRAKTVSTIFNAYTMYIASQRVPRKRTDARAGDPSRARSFLPRAASAGSPIHKRSPTAALRGRTRLHTRVLAPPSILLPFLFFFYTSVGSSESPVVLEHGFGRNGNTNSKRNAYDDEDPNARACECTMDRSLDRRAAPDGKQMGYSMLDFEDNDERAHRAHVGIYVFDLDNQARNHQITKTLLVFSGSLQVRAAGRG
ncbi:hypothetical protein B0H13DRAFT_1882872 [Mycena leptocephala]|nr:hypothetical protein B0H13DRAFT_1882872 [Mycena leptocephala]